MCFIFNLGNKILLKQIKLLPEEVAELKESVKELKTMTEVSASANYVGKKSFVEEFNLNLPLRNLEDFKAFDKEFKSNNECSHRFVSLSIQKFPSCVSHFCKFNSISKYILV